ncbi:DeoR/GlpR family DNA-binding transcription regulator [Lederbergia graminis]|uniref:DeoR/GlpR family DNA-binding transcription regulator n=1 Tax=Lederbergia graminis TaxID=735518 RepID=A0ABW0LQB2_9BACI
MLVAERHMKIEQLVNEKESIRVSELSRIFQVTEETIRRDLEKLESEGKLQRSHGGAVSIKQKTSFEVPYFEREIRNMEEKKAVAEEAVKRIAVNDRIILDASSTAWYMAKRIPDIPLTVLTNSMKVAMELSTREKITLLSCGGILLSESLSFVGPIALSTLERYRVHKAFISCTGIEQVRGLSDANEMQSIVKKKMIEIADEVYLLADYSKFGVQSFSQIASINSIDYIITDSKTDSMNINTYRELGIDITCCDD